MAQKIASFGGLPLKQYSFFVTKIAVKYVRKGHHSIGQNSGTMLTYRQIEHRIDLIIKFSYRFGVAFTPKQLSASKRPVSVKINSGVVHVYDCLDLISLIKLLPSLQKI